MAETTPSERPRTLRRLLTIGLRVGVLALIGVWLYRSDEVGAMGQTLARLSIGTAAATIGLAALNSGLAVWRWRVLMHALGARRLPPPTLMLRTWLVGHFYNTFVPGAIGGDVARGVISRACFDRTATSYIVVLLERLIGLSALSLVFLAGLVVGPRLVDPAVALPWLAALLALFVVIVLVALLSGKLSMLFRQFPKVEHKAGLGIAFIISVVGHSITISLFWLFANGLDLALPMTALLLVVPLGLVASIVPIAIAGVGPREVALMGLLGLLGVPEGEALALSLAFAALMILLALIGGLVQLVGGPITLKAAEVGP